MAAPTGKLKYAYQTISNMEAVIKSKQAFIDKVIKAQSDNYGNGMCMGMGMGLHLAMIKLVKDYKNEP